jgi:hypothetical protein
LSRELQQPDYGNEYISGSSGNRVGDSEGS